MATNPLQAVVIGTRMSDTDIEAYLGFMPQQYNKRLTDLAREISVVRGYFKKTVSKKIKFYRIPGSDRQALTDGKTVIYEVLRKGIKWQPDIAFMFLDFKEAEQLVNSKYPHGDMDEQTRLLYVSDMSNELGPRFERVDLLN